jgi:thioredoxin 1
MMGNAEFRAAVEKMRAAQRRWWSEGDNLQEVASLQAAVDAELGADLAGVEQLPEGAPDSTPLGLAAGSAVQDVTGADFAAFTGGGLALVCFSADWCPACRALHPALEDAAGRLLGAAAVGRVDVSAERELTRRFRVSSIPQLVLFRSGQPVERPRAGGMSAAAIESLVRRHL